ncbi:unnamed protein product [Rotaria magnacalcarata]|uniref:Tetratricopeptide repeat protein n=2 Tax=Rotaria magnacalcarata TaxID=392030 RepID=A0A815MBX2_9BILA|nr:unnamed protein product [Rotaria magnacalcarata]CAF3801788.1 unnamed protein product [Rotaria magnacalcarata]
MNEKKATTVTISSNLAKPIDKKLEKPVLISYITGEDDKHQEDNVTYCNNAQECIQTIEQSSLPVFLILNSSSATDVLSRVHSLKKIDTIFVYCKTSREQQRCQYLCQHYSKIFDLFTDRTQLFHTIQENVNLYQNQSGNDYLRLAERYKEQNELNRALKYTHKALDIYRKTLSNPTHPLIARCLNNLGAIYDTQGDVNRSFEYYEQAIKIYSHLAPSLSNQPVSNFMKK